jgi:glycosyltransferase involved in cell wall biosynthesis
VEAQACGTPVIAYGRGGALETIKSGMTGCFFKEQTKQCIKEQINVFEQYDIRYEDCRKNSERFSKESFCSQFRKIKELL